MFVRRDGPRAMLQAPYDGPYSVVSRDKKVFVVRINGENHNISIDRLKPAYVVTDRDENDGLARLVPEAARNQESEDNDRKCKHDSLRSQRQTRSGRRVRFPERSQAGQ